MEDERILLLLEVSENEKISKMFRDRIPFIFKDKETAIDAFYYLQKTSKQCIHSAEFLSF